MRRIASTALLLLLMSCGDARLAAERNGLRSPTPAPTSAAPPVTALPTPVHESLDVDAVMAHIRALVVDIGLRNSGSTGDLRTSRYIAEEITKLGWKVERRPFPLPQGGESWNVVGTPPRFDSGKPYLLVGGHYDSLNGPGANDNASGVALSLEMARALTVKPSPLQLMFVGFGGEERQPTPAVNHHVGSKFYVSHMSPAERKNLVAMMNLDMVGHGTPIICGRIVTGPREGTNRCVATGKALQIPVRERVTPDWSDFGTFAKQGMNTVWLWTGDDKCCYHSPRDNMDRIVVDDLRDAGTLALAILRSYTG
jgi:hypothetical protein